jgi:hypothetical protein
LRDELEVGELAMAELMLDLARLQIVAVVVAVSL